MTNGKILNSKSNGMTTVKCSINTILHNNGNATIVKEKLTDVAKRASILVSRTYQFIRCYLLSRYELSLAENDSNIQLPTINIDFVKMAFTVLLTDSKKYMTLSKHDNNIPLDKRYGKLSGNNLKILEELVEFYDNNCVKLNFGNKIQGLHLSQILRYLAETMLTSIENNIREHFMDHLRHYVNQKCAYLFAAIDEQMNGKAKTDAKIALRKEIGLVKRDLLEYTLNSDAKYHQFIHESRGTVVPIKLSKQTLLCDIVDTPQKYFTYMIAMNRILQTEGKSTLQFFPLGNDNIIRYIPIDTVIIVDVLCTSNKHDKLSNITKLQYSIWKEFFNIDHKIFKINGNNSNGDAKRKYVFKYLMYTDCCAVSLLFEENSSSDNTAKKYELMKIGRNKLREDRKDKSKEELFKDKEARDTKKQAERNKKRKDAEQKRAKYNALSKEEKATITKANKDKRESERLLKEQEFDSKSDQEKQQFLDEQERKVRATQPEFPYLDELTTKQLEELSTRNKVYVDPGKIRILTLLGQPVNPKPIECNHKDKDITNCSRCKSKELVVVKYTSKQRVKETKRMDYMYKRQRYKDNNGITALEKQLSDYNSKSCHFNEFVKYVAKKNELSSELLEKYEAPIFRRLRWYGYINKQRSEYKLVNTIKKTFGDDCVLIMGDWSISKQMRNHIPTPMIGLKRFLRKYFDIINLDEFKTSKLNNKTKTECDNLKLWVKKKPKKRPRPCTLKECGVASLLEDSPSWSSKRPDQKVDSTIGAQDPQYGHYSMHSILTYKMENNRLGCINRDKNAVYNMKEIAEYWFQHKKRHPAFKRPSKAELEAKKTPAANTKTRRQRTRNTNAGGTKTRRVKAGIKTKTAGNLS